MGSKSKDIAIVMYKQTNKAQRSADKIYAQSICFETSWLDLSDKMKIPKFVFIGIEWSF